MNGFGSQEAPKRFYKQAGVEAGERGWRVVLDGRPVRTPAKQVLEALTEALAGAIAEEWDRQEDVIDASSMPMLRLANVALDRTPDARAEMADEFARYAETDLVCHMAEGPEELRARQEEAWRPLRDWAGETLGIVLIGVDGVLAGVQPPASLDAARAHAASLDDFRLTGLVYATGLLGSAVLAVAVEQGRLSADEAVDASLIDETWQAEKWGRDSEAEARIAALREDARALGRWFDALG
ncbi:MAG: ATP12 family protein [Pseudomonadota bacterium]